MAQRTTTNAVETILGDGANWDGITSVQPFVDSATVIVDRVYTCANNKGITLTTAELELIERWLAAHFYAMQDPLYQSRSTSGASGQFQGQTGMRLDATTYGQQAKLIDYSGCLENIDKRQVARLAWLGKPKSSQVDYEDRD